jgi:hypothetical protein
MTSAERRLEVPMSNPFAVALIALVFALATLAIGGWLHEKGAVPLAFLVGGAMMLGGLSIGLKREVTNMIRRRLDGR